MQRPNLRTLTTSLVALMIPITIVVSVLTALYFKSTNPDNVDVSQDLAYLQQTIVAGIITFVLFTVAVVTGIVLMYRRDRNFSNAKLPLVLLLIVCTLMAGIIVVSSYTSKVTDQYLIDHGKPTLQQFFDALDKQKTN